MCNSTDERGISLTEVLIAVFLLSFGVLALISIQPAAWTLSGRSDYLGRAVGVLHEELETNEALIINPCNANPCSAANPLTSTRNAQISGQAAAQPGDVTMTIQTTLTDNLNNTWTVNVRVTWPGNATGVRESRVVSRQEHFRFPLGCI